MSWPFPERNLGSLCCEIAIFANGSLSGLDKDLDKKEASRGKKTTCAVHYQTHYRYLATISCCFLIFGISDCAFPGVVQTAHLCVVPGGKGGKGGKDNWGKSGKAAPPSKGGKGKAGKAATGGKGPKGATLEPAKVNDSKRSSAWIERHR